MSCIFPDGFLWGAATAAYQIEGAPFADGKGPSIWDVFTHTPGKTASGDTGDIACDHYARFREDVALMGELGLRAYRFSISWPRVQPQGRGPINEAGLRFYDKLIDALCAAGIEPMVTLYHWDLPAALQMELGGWIHQDVPRIFADYASLIYDRLGDRVRFWITINEPWCIVDGGYFCGVMAPGVRDIRHGYQAGHQLMRAHAFAAAACRTSRHPGGQVSFALNSNYCFPASESAEDLAAAQRALVDFAGWFGDPAYYGDYPAIMRERYGDLLPEFSAEDRRLLEKSLDFIALNYYTSDWIRCAPGSDAMELEKQAPPDHARTEMNWPIVPEGLERLLCWVSNRYPSKPVYVTENGAAMPDRPDAAGFVNDQDRIGYLRDHFAAARRAMRSGVDLRGYMVWSLLDNLEWSLGYAKRFGLIRCDFPTQQRIIKASGRWYANVIRSNCIDAAEAV